MDSDDALSQEAVEEIRQIVQSPVSSHLAWRLPTRIFFGGENISEAREIKHEAAYPSYQTRLVHQSVGAKFRGRVHDRLSFDEKKFPVGTMKSFYNFHWPRERVENYGKYIDAYGRRELEVLKFKGLDDFLYWSVYRRVRTIFGYLLWRLPAMYLRYGFKDSMPISIELLIVRSHAKILFGSVKKYIMTL